MILYIKFFIILINFFSQKPALLKLKPKQLLPRKRTYDIRKAQWGLFGKPLCLWLKPEENPLVVYIYEKNPLGEDFFVCKFCQSHKEYSYIKLLINDEKLLEITKHFCLCSKPATIIKNLPQ